MAEPRAVCMRCRRPEAVCYCRFVTPLHTRTRVVIFQHPRERDVPINTARIASLCLPDAELHVGVRWSGSSALARALDDPERPAALLYPGPGAIDVERDPPRGPITLVVVDGTWWQARKIVRQNPELAALPRYAFRPPAPSSYRIRREPEPTYVSTIEALAHVLAVLEGDASGPRALLEPFRAMVEAQLAYVARGKGGRHVARPRQRPAKDPRSRLPRALRERAGDLLCVYAEANAWPMKHPARRDAELVQLVACRPRTGEAFERIARPEGPLAPGTARHTLVDEETLLAGDALDELRRAFSDFLRPGDLVATWGPYAVDLATSAGVSLPDDRIDLRSAAHQYVNAKAGEIDAFAARLGLPLPDAQLGRGRAGWRLAQMVAIAKALA